MKAFIGRFGAPSGRMPGVGYCRVGTSGMGLTDGVCTGALTSDDEGDSERGAVTSDRAASVRLAERRMAPISSLRAPPARGWVGRKRTTDSALSPVVGARTNAGKSAMVARFPASRPQVLVRYTS